MLEIVNAYKNKADRRRRKSDGKEYKMKEYIESIKKAQTLEELDNIVELAAIDDTITNEQYCTLYSIALQQAQNL